METGRFPRLAVIVAASALGVNGTLAFAEPNEEAVRKSAADAGGAPGWIASGAAGALLPPSDWNCDEYVAEYRQFLDDGNDADEWRFVGKRYRSDDDGQFYDWNMWLEWEEDASCIGPGSANLGGADGGVGPTVGTGSSGGGGFGGMTAVGTVVGVLGLGGVAVAGGGGGGDSSPPSKSPG